MNYFTKAKPYNSLNEYYKAKYQKNLEIMNKLKTEISKYESLGKGAIFFKDKMKTKY